MATKHVLGQPFALPKMREYETTSDEYRRQQTALGAASGAASGAMAGAGIGTQVAPGYGTVLGGILGGVIGGVAGGVKGNKAAQADAQATVSEQREAADQQQVSQAYQRQKGSKKYGSDELDFATNQGTNTAYDAWSSARY